LTQKEKEDYLLDNLKILPILPSNSHYNVEFLFLYKDNRVELLKFNDPATANYQSQDGNFAVGSFLTTTDYIVIDYFDFIFKEYTSDTTPPYYGCDYSVGDDVHIFAWLEELNSHSWTLKDNGTVTDYYVTLDYNGSYSCSGGYSLIGATYSNLFDAQNSLKNAYINDGYPNTWSSTDRPLYTQAKAFMQCLSTLSICCLDRC